VICLRGNPIYETELGRVELKPGDMLLIPRGISHLPMGSPGDGDAVNLILESKKSVRHDPRPGHG
jgi:quercetin dioxygenase-like cupin family protein